MIENLGLTLVTLLFHFSTKWSNARTTAKEAEQVRPSLIAFAADNPAYITTTVLGTAAAFYGFVLMDWMNPGSALAIGWAGSSMAKNTAEKFANEDRA